MPDSSDAACGTGLLLAQLAHLFPTAELYGIDASQAMLDQASRLLQHHPQVHLSHASLQGNKTAGLPYDPASFDLITFTNTLHYLKDPQTTLYGLQNLLVPDGQMVIEDYVLRGFPYPWRAFEWAIKLYDPQHVRLYTLSEMQEICRSINLQVVYAKSFSIDLFCHSLIHDVGGSQMCKKSKKSQANKANHYPTRRNGQNNTSCS